MSCLVTVAQSLKVIFLCYSLFLTSTCYNYCRLSVEQYLLAELHILDTDTKDKLDNLKKHFRKTTCVCWGTEEGSYFLGFCPPENVFCRYFPLLTQHLARAPTIKKKNSIISPAVLKEMIPNLT